MQVLVLEKSTMIRRLIREDLSQGDYSILEAGNTVEARRILLKEPNIVLMTLGTVLAGANGFDFLEEVNSAEFRALLRPLNSDRMCAIFVTANDSDADRLRGYDLGAVDFIQKPWPKGQLLARIDLALGRHEGANTASHWRVLLVDDSPVNRAVGSRLLAKMGCEVEVASSGEQALSLFQARTSTHFHMILMDLMMPGMSGLETTRAIRSWEATRAQDEPDGGTAVPIVALTASNQNDEAAACLEAGMNDFLDKPFRWENVRESLQRWAPVPVESQRSASSQESSQPDRQNT